MAKAITTAQLTGQYVMTYRSLLSTLGDDGSSASVQAIEGTDSIAIVNFWQEGITVKAKVDPAKGTFTIKPQWLYDHSTYGAMWLGFCESDGKPSYTKNLEGSVGADGSLQISSWWGVFVKSGTQAGAIMYAGYNALLQKSNAVMKCTADVTGTETSYNVLVSQPQQNTVSVVNFGNHGQTVLINIDDDLSGVIPQQVIYNYPQNGDFLSYSYTSYTNTPSVSIQGLAAGIQLDKAASQTTRKLSWKKWTALSRGSKTILLGAWSTAEIVSEVDITYPKLNVSALAGSGTEADPYRLTSLDDLIFLSKEARKTAVVDPAGGQFSRAFKGKYFKVMNDIDMSGYRFTPICNSYTLIFAGNLDGAGHKISNLYVEDMSNGYAGLFGRIDSLTVFKNLTLVNPKVTGAGMWVGSLCGYSMGTLENINVQGGEIINYGSATGGITGSAYVMRDCHVKGTGVLGLGGWIGGLTGEVYTSVDNSDAVDVRVLGSVSSGYTLGGAIGSLYGSGNNIYASGLMDGMTLRASDGTGIQAGGIVGEVAGGHLTNAFAVGDVRGYGSYCAAGGVAGQVTGGTIENAYFRGTVFTSFSRKTGGLVGYVRGTGNGGRKLYSTFKNMYVSATVRGEDYQYNKETGAIETLGQIDEGAIKSAANIYFDKQVYNHNSKNYTGLTTAEMTSATGLAGFGSDVWTFTAGQYPRLRKFETTQAAQLGASAILFNPTASVNKVNQSVRLTPMGDTRFLFLVGGKLTDKGHYASIAGDSLKISEQFGIDTLCFVNGGTQFAYYLNIAPVPFDGLGTEEEPYLIQTRSDLETLSKITTINKQYFPATYFRQTADIDLGYSEDFIGIAADGPDAHSQFAGIYDGGGFTIHKMRVRGLKWKTAPSADNGWLGTPLTGTTGSYSYQGFIGRLHTDGVLRNLRFAADCDATTEVWASSGLAVGANNGLIENVRNYADITGVSCWIGGVAGMNEKSGRIIGCFNSGDVTSGYNTAGGISGKNDGIVENCANTGDVAVKKIANFGRADNYNLAGGITPTMSGGICRNVFNAGTVTATDHAAGGIVASLNKNTSATATANNDVIGAINIGTVRTADLSSIGAIGGLNPTANGITTTGTVLAYFDEQIVPYPAVGNQAFDGAHGVGTSTLTSGTALEGLDAQIWQFDKGMYPVLKSFADEPSMQEARKMILSLPAGVTAGNVSEDGTLSFGFIWKLNNSDYFSISDATLDTDTVPSQVIKAVLTAQGSDFTRPFDLRRIPAVPLQGQGTEQSPYLISSVDDWNNLSAYIDNVNESFPGKYLRITANLAFNANFKPLFMNPADQLSGTLDGDGHTLTGVTFTPTDRYQGALRSVGKSGVLKNLTMQGEVTSKFGYTGGVTGRVYGRMSNVINKIDVTVATGTLAGVSGFGSLCTGAVLEDCVNEGAITGPATYLGGLAAEAQTGVSIIRCGNKGTVKSTYNKTSTSACQSIGGLIGSCNPNELTDCYNTGKIEFTNPVAIYGVGGLIGTANGDAAAPEGLRLTGCYNTADIEAGWTIGGLVGNVNATAAMPNPMVLRRCYNSGNLTSKATASKSSTGMGGLLALFTPGTLVDSCYNTGTITQSAKCTYAGGLIGYYKIAPTEALPMTISNSYNAGTVNAVGNQGGGIIAYTQHYTTIADCYNTGNVTGGFGLGGITANLGSATAKMLRCYNTGKISSNKNRAGGLIGWNSSNSTVEDCFNAGEVEITIDPVENANNHNLTDGYSAGGLAGASAASYVRCYNIGTVTGKCRVGGLVGETSKNTTSFTSCYNAGKLVAPVDTCGNIIGINPVNNGRYWTADNKVSGVYYLSQDSVRADTIGSALDSRALAALQLGEGWTSDGYTYPLLADNQPDFARLFAAQVVLSEADAKTGVITGDFHVGMPQGLNWTPSTAYAALFGNEFKWNTAYKGKLTLTANIGTLTKTVELDVDTQATYDGIDDVDAARELQSEQWYTTAGLRIAKPTEHDGQLYIVIRCYTDGTRTTERVLNR